MIPQNNIIKLAGAIKPPASRTEIIEALAIRKREQIIAENAAMQKELEQLNKKIQIVAAEVMAAGAKPSGCCDYRIYVRKDSDGRLTVGEVTREYSAKPTAELAEMCRRQYRLRHDKNIFNTPSLHEVRQQVRAALANNTPPAVRVKSLLTDPESQKMLDVLLARLDNKPLALTA